jgi:surface antigen
MIIKMSTLIVVLVLTCICFADVVCQTQSGDTPRTDSMGDQNQVFDAGKGAGSMHHVFPRGQCTQCAADEYRARTGRNVTWRGNAKDWLVNASNAGFSISYRPSSIVRNSILVFGPAKMKDGSINPYGHVAIADSVSRTSITVTECNYAYPLRKTTRTIKLDDLSRLKFMGIVLPPSNRFYGPTRLAINFRGKGGKRCCEY